MPNAEQIASWESLAAQLRADSIRCTTAAGSGHPTSGMSAADLMAVLQTSYMKYDYANPNHPNNDHLIFSKGHACPVLYAMYRAADAISEADLLSVRKFGSIYEGHPTPLIPYVDAATGSLGQGLAIAAGVALGAKYLEKLPYRTWCLLGDSEMAEGSVYEAMAFAAHYELDNLVAIVDVNRLGQRGPTALGHHMEIYKARAEAFGWHAIVIDGHDVSAVDAAYAEAVAFTGKPVAILAETFKGHGVSFLNDAPGWHGKALKPDEAEKALAELGNPKDAIVKPGLPEDLKPAALPAVGEIKLPVYEVGKLVAVRKAWGDALAAVGAARPEIVAVDAEVGNSTYTEIFGNKFPERAFQAYIAEQVMVGVCQGLDVQKHVAFCATFAAFFARAYDQIRMAAVSGAHLRLVGTHAGVSIGEDGASQMALEDLAMMRSVHGSTVLYPSDATCAAHLVAAMADIDGISYLRATREATPVLYGPEETFPIGGSKTLMSSGSDVATVIAAGITLHEALEAVKTLAADGIAVRVIDLYSVKPVDTETLVKAATETGHLVIAEDHWVEGGLFDVVIAALTIAGVSAKKITHLAIREIPRSGKPAELLAAYGIDAAAIAAAVKG